MAYLSLLLLFSLSFLLFFSFTFIYLFHLFSYFNWAAEALSKPIFHPLLRIETDKNKCDLLGDHQLVTLQNPILSIYYNGLGLLIGGCTVEPTNFYCVRGIDQFLLCGWDRPISCKDFLHIPCQTDSGRMHHHSWVKFGLRHVKEVNLFLSSSRFKAYAPPYFFFLTQEYITNIFSLLIEPQGRSMGPL